MNKEELKVKYGDEKVLCISNHHLNSWFRTEPNKIDALTKGMSYHSYFDYRYNAEIDYTAKQVIPYVVLKHGDKYFVTTRLKGDSRLVGGSSIAVGGHINPEDAAIEALPEFTLLNCIYRELLEETTVTKKALSMANIEYKTVFVDESSDVSKVHVCLLTVVDLSDSELVDIKETDKLLGMWMTAEEIMVIMDAFEGWSKIAIDLLGIGHAEAEPAPKKRKKSKVTKTNDENE
jgi:predicted NUDIX family phosphoesterase